MNVQEVAAQYGEYLIEKRRYFHQHPEVSTKEYHTSKAIKEALDEIGVSWRPCGLMRAKTRALCMPAAMTAILRCS